MFDPYWVAVVGGIPTVKGYEIESATSSSRLIQSPELFPVAVMRHLDDFELLSDTPTHFDTL